MLISLLMLVLISILIQQRHLMTDVAEMVLHGCLKRFAYPKAVRRHGAGVVANELDTVGNSRRRFRRGTHGVWVLLGVGGVGKGPIFNVNLVVVNDIDNRQFGCLGLACEIVPHTPLVHSQALESRRRS